jgi:hypothetical protein
MGAKEDLPFLSAVVAIGPGFGQERVSSVVSDQPGERGAVQTEARANLLVGA